MKPTISIEYCPKCGWMLRAAYMAQELLTTFTDDVHGVLLQPSEVSGNYIVYIDGQKCLTAGRRGASLKLKS
jgi:selenoprotein W-related protein